MGSLIKYTRPQKVRDLEHLAQQKRQKRPKGVPLWWLIGLGLMVGIVLGGLLTDNRLLPSRSCLVAVVTWTNIDASCDW